MSFNPGSSQKRFFARGGFTLLEALISIVLIMLLMAGVFGYYHTTLKARQTAVDSLHDVLLMRSLLEQVANEIRHATDIVPGDGIGFQGTEDKLTIVQMSIPDNSTYDRQVLMQADLPPAQTDLVRIVYQLAWDEELVDENNEPICHGLNRSVQRTFDPNPRFVVSEDEDLRNGTEDREITTPQAERELFAPEIKYLKFEYFDGAEWRDRWQVAVESEDEMGGAGGLEDGLGDGGLGDGGLGDQLGGEGLGEGLGAGDTGGQGDPLGGLSGLDGSGGSGGGGQQNYALPQAVRITIGKVPLPQEELMNERLQEMEEEREQEYHEDRYTLVVYLRQADRTLLSSRQYGVDRDMQMGEQTQGY